MSQVLYMPQPICLIENVDGNNLVVNKEAEKILSEISQPVVVIAIVGKYRTGKSYLINKLAGSKNGFALGSNSQSMTRGIWMWCVPHPKNPGQTLVLLDTEGLGDVEKGDSKTDAWIFSLAVLLSSAFVFNSWGPIDHKSMEQLQYVTELTKLIKLKSSPEQDEPDDYKRFFPSFTWCVRDFTLVQENDGKPITDDEYLLSSLQPMKGTDPKIKDCNLLRECILRLFHTHKCFVFDRPASKKKLPILETLPESELEEDFLEQAAIFYNYMITHSCVKTLVGGAEVTGRMLAVLTALYVKAFQSGTVPCMETEVLALVEIENTGALQDAMSKYICEMDKHVPRFPTETQQEFLNMHMECEKEAIAVFMGRSLTKDQHKLKELIDDKMNEYSTKNENTSRDFCRKLIQEISATMENNILEGKYSVPGGHKMYLMEKLNIMEAYNLKPGKGIKSLEVMQEYISGKKDIEAAIIQADETLTEKGRLLAEERAQRENAERERQIMEENNRNLQQRMDDQSRSFKQHMEMIMEKMEQEKKMLIQQNELVISQKLKEQEKMMNAVFQEKISAMQKEIDSLRHQIKSSGSTCVVM